MGDRSVPRLEQRLILTDFLLGDLGLVSAPELRRTLARASRGTDEEGTSYFCYALVGASNLPDAARRFREYDMRILNYVRRLNVLRQDRPVELLHFQYLALVLTERFLELWFGIDGDLVARLNAHVSKRNAAAAFGELPVPLFRGDDIGKVAFWMATGSGKTLIMHANLWQHLHHGGINRYENVILLTPNEGLSAQHLAEFRRSGILSAHLSNIGSAPTLSREPTVVVAEITKLVERKRGSGVTVQVDAFGANNLVFIDEGHRGASGDTWRLLRSRLASQGFTYEYSATFGQIVNGASPARRSELLEEYSKAILYDYSYPHFYRDGFGKDYFILNWNDPSDAPSAWVMLANLLSFYQQCLRFDSSPDDVQTYNVERPLWVFVGHSVTGGKTVEDRTVLTDIEQIVVFFDSFLRNRAQFVAKLAQLLSEKTELKDANGSDLFRGLFRFVLAKGASAEDLYDSIRRRVFGADSQGSIRAVELSKANGEIALAASAGGRYFALINVGDTSGLLDILKAHGIAIGRDAMHTSLFERISAWDSTVDVLIGARKFIEGWDCFRVSSMGLMNIGRGEGSQIVQLFGRGVRLRGRGASMKRTDPAQAPADWNLLETLHVFGLRASYMGDKSGFRRYLKEEGIEPDLVPLRVPVRSADGWSRHALLTLRRDGGSYDEKGEPAILSVDPSLTSTLDIRPTVAVIDSGAGDEPGGRLAGRDYILELRKMESLFDWDQLYLDMLQFRSLRRLRNLYFDAQSLRTVLQKGDLHLLASELPWDAGRFVALPAAMNAAASLLRKYLAAFYDGKRKAWESRRLNLVSLDVQDPNIAFGGYDLRATPELAVEVQRLVDQAKDLYEDDVKGFPNIHFAGHLYQPLLTFDVRIESAYPPLLNPGERNFVRELKQYLMQRPASLVAKHVFLLRNLARGRGVSLFDAPTGDSFFPDFILWVVSGGRQSIAFVDPHGLLWARSLAHPKIAVHRELAKLEEELRRRATSQAPTVSRLTSYIVSVTPYASLRKAFGFKVNSEADFEREHVLFADDPTYIRKIIDELAAAT